MDWIALLTALVWVVGGVYLAHGWTRFEGVRSVHAAVGRQHELPLVSVIIPARDESLSIEETLKCLGAATYPNLEVIVVNDRSRDETSALARRFAGTSSRFQVVDIEHLPELWLGKTHAMQVGYGQSSGDWLCFIDADVRLEPDCIEVAVRVGLDRGLDHLSLFPSLKFSGALEGAFVMAFAFFFGAHVQPWKAKDPRSDKFCGVGAFNLVRRDAYEGVGAHRALRLEVADDLKLGKLVKAKGYHQDAMDGEGLLSVQWQRGGLRGYVRGLEKNAFAGLEYSLFRVAGASAGVILLSILPFVTLVTGHGPARWASAVSVAMIGLAHVPIAHQMGARWFYAIAHPLAASLLLWSIWRSTGLTLGRGAVRWRDTDYPLELLRKHKV